MKVIKGDLIALALEGNFDVIIHGCNCMNKMGKGIALQIKETFPVVFEAYTKIPPGKAKLGTIQLVKVNETPLYVVNAHTQYDYKNNPGDKGVFADYAAIESCFKTLPFSINQIKSEFPVRHKIRIGYPKIGAGLAGGDWEIISKIIDKYLQYYDHTLVEYSK
jgi:O-acetyl-ADP-ribose deacetylase (regulator of RNase III)